MSQLTVLGASGQLTALGSSRPSADAALPELPTIAATRVGFWLSAAPATMFSDAGTTQAAGTDPVQEWWDYAGNGAKLLATAPNRPVRVPNAINSTKPLLNTNGGKYFVHSPSVNTGGNQLFFCIVFKGNSFANNQRILGMTSNIASGTDYSDGGGGMVYVTATPTIAGFRGGGADAATGTVSTGTVYCLFSKWHLGTPLHSIKLEDAGSYTTDATVSGTFNIDAFLIGAGIVTGSINTGGAVNADIQIGAVGIWSGALTGPEETALLDFLQDPAIFGAGSLH